MIKKAKKCELHAHLFGSISQDQLLTWLKEKKFIKEYDEFK